jgi:predicted Rossmann fold nucleotide-binding protein DprA/Smf involved in DNA uptake
VDGLLGLGPAESERVVQLLARVGQLAFELDRLRSRGLWVVTLADDAYPERLRDRLTVDAPPVLFGAGERSMLTSGGVAIVGSRDGDDAAEDFTRRLAAGVVAGGSQLVSGGARGVDVWAMQAAFAADGAVVGVLPEGVERRLRDPANRAAVAGGRATLVSPYRPDASFSAGAAMARNKLIYALSDVAVVVSSSKGSGGTWTGALEALKAGWVPVLVRAGEGVPDGNRELMRLGAGSLDAATPLDVVDLDLLRSFALPATGLVAEDGAPYVQSELFGD